MKRVIDNTQGIGSIKTKEDVKRKVVLLGSFYGSYACSDGTWRILLDTYDEMITRDFLKVGSINRGGAAVDGRCGIVASAIAFLSYIGGRVTPDEDISRLEYWSKKVHEEFARQLGYYSCGELWPDVEEKIERKELIRWTSCIICEGLPAISDIVYDAYIDLKSNKLNQTDEVCNVEDSEGFYPEKTEEELVRIVLERSREYKKLGFTCSEAALRALLEGFEIEWSDKEKQIGSIYSRGSFIGDRCGILEVALLIVSYKYGRNDCRRKHLEDRMLSRKLHQRVDAELGSTFCGKLTGAEKDVEYTCLCMEKILEICTRFIFHADQMVKDELEAFIVETEGKLY